MRIRAELSTKRWEERKGVLSNLRQLLMQPPVKDTVTLGLDGICSRLQTAVVERYGQGA